MARTALSIEHLSFKFHRRSPFFFHDLSFTLDENKLHFVQGKNGSGKTTLFRILRGNTSKDEFVSGVFHIYDQVYSASDNHPLDKEFTNKIKMVPQKFDLMIADQFTFTENLRLANMPEYPTIAQLPPHQPLPDLIKRFGIDYSKPSQLLSGGQRQILAILMALQKPTTILLLDEPTAALDEKNATMVMEFLSELIRSIAITIVVICHDKDLVFRYASDSFFEIEVDEQTETRRIIKVPISRHV